MINQSGEAADGPVQTGDFADFSAVPLSSSSLSGYGDCDIADSGNSGNPWGIGIPIPGVSENVDPVSGEYCDDGTTFLDSGTI
jgi:hypothetical protein